MAFLHPDVVDAAIWQNSSSQSARNSMDRVSHEVRGRRAVELGMEAEHNGHGYIDQLNVIVIDT